MIDGKRVVCWTPYGREATVSILAEYMERDYRAGIVDEWWLCLNTDPDQVTDLAYAYQLAGLSQRSTDPFISIRERPAGRPRRRPKQRNTGYFYEYMTDEDTVYVRFDDDIVYVEPNAIERLVRHRLEHQQGVCSFPVMWNNAIVSWYAQQAGLIPAAGTVTEDYTWPKVGGPYCMDPVGWADGRFAVAIHRQLLDALETGDADAPEGFFLYQDMPIQPGTQFSVSVFASLGSLYKSLPEPGVLVPYEEENWHTVHQPQVLNQPNILVGDALVSHYTFFPQGAIVRGTNILDRYRALAQKVNR